jgi:phytoene desaturase
VISTADYHYTETVLLPRDSRSYSDSYWEKKTMAPSCLLYYVGLNKKLGNLAHHSLFFDVPFELHGKEIYKDPKWPSEPLFYVSSASQTDPKAAPPGFENLVFLIPVASGLGGDTEALRDNYFRHIVKRMEARIGEPILDSIVVKRSWSISDFASAYNSFKGNAYGLANTLRQTAFLRPSCQSKKVKNLFYAGQLTVPGPGVPPCIISGEVSVKQLVSQSK